MRNIGVMKLLVAIFVANIIESYIAPILIKAYINVGSKFGDGAVIDYEFRSIDVFTYVDIHSIDDRVKRYYAK